MFSKLIISYAVILLPAHPASFVHKFFISASPGESRDAIVLQTCH